MGFIDITSGGQIFTTAKSCGNAGNITLNASDRLNISGSNPGIAIIPATGWVFNNKGEVTLIGSQSEIANPIDTSTTCQSE